MPWLPEVFAAPTLQLILDQRRREALLAVPYFDGLLAGDPDPLVESFAGEPEVHDPVRGRIRGVPAFRAFVAQTSAWLHQNHATVDDVEHVILERRGFEEVVLRLNTDRGPVDLPVAVVAEREADGRIDEVRVYFSTAPISGRPARRQPLLQPDPGLPVSEAVARYLRALAVGDVDEVVAAFEPDGTVREASGRLVNGGPEGLNAFYSQLLADGGTSVEPCALIGDGQVCSLEYNVVRRGTTELAPRAGLGVFEVGGTGRLAALRLYDELDPSLQLDA
jgi:hypothetical protein